MKNYSILLAAALGAAVACSAPTEENAEVPAELGYQVYTIRENLSDSTAIYAALAQTGEMGLTLAESFGWNPTDNKFLGISGANWKSMLHAHGQTSISGHYMPFELLGNEVKAIDTTVIPGMLDAAAAMGQHWVIVPWMMPQWRNEAGAAEVASFVNALGRQANARGMRAGYHNHDFEFLTPMADGSTMYDYLLAHCPRELVDFEMDLYWVAKAGQDPLTWFAQHPGRFVLWHVKDMDPIDSALQVPVGQGQIDWLRIFAAREQAGMQHYFLEQDECQAGQTAMECLKASSDYGKAALQPAVAVKPE